MAVTTVKTIKFEDVMKIMKKFVSRKESRPVLKYVYNDKQYLYATNSHILLRVNKEYISDIPEFTFYDPKNMTIINDKCNYPDCSRLIPIDFNSTITLDGNLKELHNHVKEIKKVVKKNINHIMKMEFYKNETIVSGDNYEKDEKYKEYFASIKSLQTEGQELTLHLSANYLNDALETIKKLSKVSYNHVQLGIVSNMRPMNFKQEDVFDIIVLPIRTY
jgi:DNA polymerase III sliding clamp (beta) subunit (PCNA family)